MSSTVSQSLFPIRVDGNEYFMDLPQWETDYIQSNLAKSSSPYELEMLQAMKSVLMEGDLVLDVGANIGNHTFYLAKIVGCRVIAFEPNPIFYFPFQKSISINDLEDLVSLVPKGVGAAEAQATFKELIPQNLGAQALSIVNAEIVENNSDLLDIVVLDSFSFDAPVKAIKIDVEGMELEVLQGAKKLIQKDRPSLFIESHNSELFIEIFNFIKKWDYVYWGTFNATPTNWFIPKDKALSTDLQFYSLEQGKKMYALLAEKDHLRQSFLGMQARCKKLQEQLSNMEEERKGLDEKVDSEWNFSSEECLRKG
ncbi:FkbM family methyltransferase [Paenalcaligenes hominis]|uniref:FkbM family methyltransferase n=1 Tax=Paenalcaligenes hominis TaxID=643674 RepID=UPI0035235F46